MIPKSKTIKKMNACRASSSSVEPMGDLSDPSQAPVNPESETMRTLYQTEIKSNKGIANIGNTFTTEMTDCSNITVHVNSIERSQPTQQHSTQLMDYGLHQLQDSLRLLYQTEEAWLTPFPWVEPREFATDDYFIHMDLEELDRKGQKVTKSDVVVHNILESFDENLSRAPRRVLLQAEAGFGKSTTCTKLALDWAAKVNIVKFDLVVLVRLRSLTCSLEDYVCQFCMSASRIYLTDQDTKHLLSGMGGKLLLILDGLDEASESTLKTLMSVIAFNHDSDIQSYLSGATILLTARPDAVADIIKYSDRHIRIRGMSLEERKQFVRHYFPPDHDLENIMSLLDSKYFKIDISPLMLTLICCLEEEKLLPPANEYRKLFEAILTFLGKRYFTRENISWTDEDITNHLKHLGEVCYNLLKKDKLCFTLSELNQMNPVSIPFVTGCGVFKKQLTFYKSPHVVYEPVHKTFMEHLAIIYLQGYLNQISDINGKQVFLYSVIQPISGTRNKIRVFDFGEGGNICFRAHVVKESIDVIITKSKGNELRETFMTVEFVPTREAILLFEQWYNYTSPVSFQAEVCLEMTENLPDLTAIPLEFREDIVFILNEHGRVICDYKQFRPCRCTFDSNLFQDDDKHIKQIIYVKYFELNKPCQRCNFVESRHQLDMIERALNRASCFNISMTPIELGAIQTFFSARHNQKVRNTNKANSQITYKGEFQGMYTVFMYVMDISGLIIDRSTTLDMKSQGTFLIWILNCLGFAKKGSTCNVFDAGKGLTLSVKYNSDTFIFMKNGLGENTYKHCKSNEPIKQASSALVKKWLKKWGCDNVPLQDTNFELMFLDSPNYFPCMVELSIKECSRESRNLSEFLWKRNSFQ